MALGLKSFLYVDRRRATGKPLGSEKARALEVPSAVEVRAGGFLLPAEGFLEKRAGAKDLGRCYSKTWMRGHCGQGQSILGRGTTLGSVRTIQK